MYDKLTHRNRITAAVMLVIVATVAIIALMLWRSDLDSDSIITGITVCMIFSVPCLIIAVASLIYPLRLKRFADSLDESLDHYLRKSSYRIDGKYYWYKDYFLDLTKLKTVDYSKIKSITVFTNSAGFGVARAKIGGFNVHHKPLIPISVSYNLRIRYGFKSILIRTGDSEKFCRQLINIFKKKNSNIEIITL